MAETIDPFDDFDPEAMPADPHGRPLAKVYASEEEVPTSVKPLQSLADAIPRISKAAERARERFEEAREKFHAEGGACFNCRDTGITRLRGEGTDPNIYCHCVKGDEQAAAARRRKNDLLIREAGGNEYILPFETHPLSARGKKALLDWITHFPYYPEGSCKPWLTLVGITGGGKSQIAAAIMRRLIIDRQLPGAFIDCVQLVADLREQFSRKTAPPADLEKARHAPIIVLDDIGAWKHSDYAEEQMLAIIARRYARKMPTIITTNLDTDDGSLAALVGDRAFGRIVELSYIARVGTKPEDNLRLKR